MKVCISGITGQLGSYLTDIYVEKNWEVHGLIRRSSTDTTDRLRKSKNKITLHEGDITDITSLHRLISEIRPDIIINCAAMSHVHTSFNEPQHTFNTTLGGVVNFLEIIRLFPSIKFTQLGSSEEFGSNFDKVNDEQFQNEKTRLWGNSPYAIAKLAAHNMVDLYRKSYNLDLKTAICFNMESSRRGDNFVTKKISNYVHNLHNDRLLGFGREELMEKRPKLKLGNLDACRDWSYCKDSAYGIAKLAESDFREDFVFCSGETHTIKDFLEEAFFLIKLNWKDFVEVDSTFLRPCEVPFLKGDATKAAIRLDWKPKIDFKTLVKMMVEGRE